MFALYGRQTSTGWSETVRSDISRSGPAGHLLAGMARPGNCRQGSKPIQGYPRIDRRRSSFLEKSGRNQSDSFDSRDFTIFMIFTPPRACTLSGVTVANSIQQLSACTPCPQAAWQPSRARPGPDFEIFGPAGWGTHTRGGWGRCLAGS